MLNLLSHGYCDLKAVKGSSKEPTPSEILPGCWHNTPGRVQGSLLQQMNLQASNQSQVSVLVLAPGTAASTNREEPVLQRWRFSTW